MYGNSNLITRTPDAATPWATRFMNGESIGAPAPCANRSVFAAVFGPSMMTDAMHRIIEQRGASAQHEREVSEPPFRNPLTPTSTHLGAGLRRRGRSERSQGLSEFLQIASDARPLAHPIQPGGESAKFRRRPAFHQRHDVDRREARDVGDAELPAQVILLAKIAVEPLILPRQLRLGLRYRGGIARRRVGLQEHLAHQHGLIWRNHSVA